MHLSKTVLVAIAAYASGVAARPWQQGAPNPPVFQLGKRYANTTSSSSMSTETSSSATVSSHSTTVSTSATSEMSTSSSTASTSRSTTVSTSATSEMSTVSSTAASSHSTTISTATTPRSSTSSEASPLLETSSSSHSTTVSTATTPRTSESSETSVSTSRLSLTLSSTHSITTISPTISSSISEHTSEPTTSETSSTSGSHVSTVSSSSSIAHSSITGSVSSSESLPVTRSSSSAVATSGTHSSSSSSTSASASATAAPFAVQGGTYAAVGCYMDVANVGFPLINAIKAADMATAPQCLNLCASPTIGGPYVYAGVEGTECFCSNNFATAAPQSPGACTSGLKKRADGAIMIYNFTPATVSTVSSTITPSSTQHSATTTSMSLQTSTHVSSVSSEASSSLTQGEQTLSVTKSQSTATVTSSISPSVMATSSTFATHTMIQTYPTTLLTTVQNSQTSTGQSSMSSSTISQAGTTQPSAQPTQSGSQQGYIVAAGDTLSSIAQEFGISLSELEALNRQIPNPNNIQVGQVINVPSSRAFTYTVAAGDTLSSIAQALGISLSALETLNKQIPNPNNIQIGQVVNILSPNAFTYTVVAGDTLTSIAQTFGISLSALEALNRQISNPDFIQIGQVINVPSPRTFLYSVEAGDTLSSIAQSFGVSLSALKASNSQIQNPNLIFPGQVITVPLPTQRKTKRVDSCPSCRGVAKRGANGAEFVVTSVHQTAATIEVGLASKPIAG